MAKKWTQATLAAVIDHTLLKPEATPEQVRIICQEALENGFAAVCVNPYYIPLVAEELKGSPVKACSVVGFPLGANPTDIKVQETKYVVARGAREVDMVVNIGLLKAGNVLAVKQDIAAVVGVAKGAIVKVILETCFLSREEKVAACNAAKEAGAYFVKTSTGFGSGGATVDDVKLMRSVVGSSMKIKASGGIRSLETALAMLEAGADRLGASAGIAILKELSE